jgi:4-amino-4-deoxy-L-arabinose transferase-like glycosyltransferase
MMKEMTQYFAGEKQESLLFIAVGLIAIGVAAWLWANGHRLRFMAVPLVVIALMQLVVGGTIYLRTDAQVQSLLTQSQSAPAQFKQDEVSRMQTVMKNFKLYKTVEMVLLVLGVGLIAFLQRFDVAAGVGAGLVLQASFTLALDMFAETRGQDYIGALKGWLT